MLDIERLMIAAEVAKKVLAERVVILVALVMTFGLFAWAMSEPSTVTCWIAISFAVVVFLPVLVGGRRAQAPPEVSGDVG
jgi:hypothetical protein